MYMDLIVQSNPSYIVRGGGCIQPEELRQFSKYQSTPSKPEACIHLIFYDPQNQLQMAKLTSQVKQFWYR